MLRYTLFFVVITLTNIIQGITGFAGTILAMPPSLMLVGYNVGKPVLNVLGLLSGIYVFLGHRRSVNWKELKKIVIIMAAGILGGIFVKGLFVGKEQILYRLLGVFVIFLAVQGLYNQYRQAHGIVSVRQTPAPVMNGILVAAGLVHGIFVSGGPLLIGYLTKKIQDKVSFRATISTVWVFLNTLIMLDDVRAGLWTPELMVVQLIAIPFFLAGMFIGSKLYARMSQQLFMNITYVLLFVSGLSLLCK